MVFSDKKSRKLADVRNSFFARLSNNLRLYFLYRFILVKLGYENPFSCVIKVTSRCGLNCSHCPWPKNQEKEMTTAEVKNKIDEAHNLGCITVVFEGGEPTLRTDLTELIDHAKSKKMSTIVITNGQNDVLAYEPNSIIISVEGDREYHEKIRGENTFDKILANVRNNDKIIILMTISRANKNIYAALPEIFPGQIIYYNFMYPYRGAKDEALNKTEAGSIAKNIIKLKKQYKNIGNSLSYLKNVGGRVYCYDWYTFLVNYDGQSRIGCTVEQLEKADCSNCYLICYTEVCHALKAKPDAALSMIRVAGLNFKKIFSRQ
jgi:MoaA/NifB/PqqE/SkfB family radical SAM enzyme